jgi:hypothetical protein
MKNPLHSLPVLVILLLACVIIAGCSTASKPSNVTSPATTGTEGATSGALYAAGDVVRNPKSTSDTAWLVLSYDPAADSYERAFLYRNADGSWGYRVDTRTEKAARTVMEKVYTEKVTTLSPSSVPVRQPTLVTLPPTTSATQGVTATTTVTASTTVSSDAKPVFKKITPDEGNAGTTISITDLIGENFLSGASVQLGKTGHANITATLVTVVSPTKISCTFALPSDAPAGAWDVIIINPNGKSAVYTNIFTLHGSANPTTTTTSSGGVDINSIDPVSGISGEYKSIRLTGSNFLDGAVVKLTKSGKTDIVASTVSRSSSTQMTCFFNLPLLSQGSWNIVVTNMDGTTGTLTNGFTVTG